jgi:STE24 endopeptidase
MFLIVLGILSLVLAFTRPLYPFVRDVETTWLLVALATIIPALLGAIVARISLLKLDGHGDDLGNGQYFFHRWYEVTQYVLGGLHAATLLCTEWLVICRKTPVVGEWPGVAGLLATVPFLISVLLLWMAAYPADRAVRQLAVEAYLLKSRPVQPVWSLSDFLAYNLRHQVLFVLLPLLLILIARDILARYEQRIVRAVGDSSVPDLLLGAAAGLVALFAPLMLRYIWLTQPLPEGPLRDKLLLLSRRLRVGCREILVWKSGGLIVNAAVMGVVAPLRYVLLTDGMLSQLEDEKIEAVYGHEVGHVKRHHILFFLLFSLISGCLITVFTAMTKGWPPTQYQIAATVLGVILILKWGLLFIVISRFFERQADLFGVRALELVGVPCEQPCLRHGITSEDRGQVPPATPAAGAVCMTCAHLFSATLHDVAVLNGISPDAGSLRHGSISDRSRFLLTLASDPRAAIRFERRVRAIKIAILVGAALSSAWAAYSLRVDHLLSTVLAAAS